MMQEWDDDDRYFVRVTEKLSQLLPENTVERTRDIDAEQLAEISKQAFHTDV